MDSENRSTRERMTREEYRAQMGLDAHEQHGRDKSGDAVARLTVVQLIACLLVIGAVFAVKKLSPSGFETVRSSYKNAMQYSMDARDVWAKIKDAANFVFEPAGVLSDETNSEAESETHSDVTAATLGKGSPELNVEANKMSFSPYYTTMSACKPVSGRISSPFGRREDPFTGEESLHSGLDIAAELGSPVSAAFYGTVTKVGEDDIAGKYILLSHADGLETFYCHCSEIVAELGAVIRQGETIALIGSTGMATGPHLHFEVRINGIKYDPARLVGGMYV